MKNLHFLLLAGMFTVGTLTFTSCSNESEVGMSTLNVRLTDAPGDFEEVNLDVKGMKVHADNGDSSKGWTSLDVVAGVYNVLDLTNGVDALIAKSQVPSGKISQIRFILGDKNTVKVGGVSYPLRVPSGMKSGIKLNVHTTLLKDIVYTIILDFDAARSVVEDGKGGYKLKPVIRTLTSAIDGGIKGSVTPAESHPAIYAIIGTDTVSAFPDDSGQYLIKGLSAGTYDLHFAPKVPYKATIVPAVNVTAGSITDAGTINMTE